MTPYYDRDGVTLYCGRAEDVLPTLPAASFGFVPTDPPYLVGYSGRWNSAWGQIEGDEDPSWVLPAFAEVYRVMAHEALCVSFYGWPHADVFVGAWKAIGFRLLSHLVWVKERWGLGYFTRGQHEQAYLLGKPQARKPAVAISDVLRFGHDRPILHANQKPVACFARLIEHYAVPGLPVLDPFAGSGTTLVAAKELGFHAVGIEVEEVHCERIVRRLEQGVLAFGG